MLSEMIGGDRVEIIIYDINGRSIQSLKSGSLKIGENRVEWDGRDGRGYSVASGVYFYALRICGNVKSIETDSKKMVLIR